MKKNQSSKSKVNKILILIAIVVLFFSLIKIGIAQKPTNIVEITNVEIASKSDTVDVDSVKFEDGIIKNNVLFHKVGDQLVYNITFNNKGDKDYVLKTITDNNENENLTYSYSGYEGAKLEANKAVTFNVIITYSKENLDITKRDYSNVVELTLIFEDEAGNQQEKEIIIEQDDNKQDGDKLHNNLLDNQSGNASTNDSITTGNNKSKKVSTESKYLNPKTGDDITGYVITAIISFLVLIVLTIKQLINKRTRDDFKKNKHKKNGIKMFGFILTIAVAVPIFATISKAATTSILKFSIDTSVKFMDKLVVSFNIDGEETESIANYNEEIDLLEVVEKPGYEFKGWFTEPNTEEDDDSKRVEEKIKVVDDIKLYAKYKIINYNISYNLNGGIVEENPETYTVEEEKMLINPTKQGYIFSGWTGTGIEGQVDNVIITKGSIGDRSYTAHFSKITGNIAITVLNENDNLYEKQIEISTIVNNIDENKVKTQYSMDNGNTWIDYSEKITVTQNCTLKARTIIKENNIVIAETSKKIVVFKKYAIVYNKNNEDATGTMENQTMTVGIAGNLIVNSFRRKGYKFDGWNTNENGTGIDYTDGQSVIDLASIDGATVNLYAKWKKFEINVGDTVYYTPSTVNEYSWDKAYATSDQQGVNILKSGKNERYNISNWYVFSVSDDSIEIVPKSPAPNVILGGAQGYNNGVKLLNDACSSLYSDPEKEITARSINIDDIENVFSEESLNIARNTNLYDGARKLWMERLSTPFTANAKYPQIYEDEYKSVIKRNGVEIEKDDGLGFSEQIEFIQRTNENNNSGLITNASSIWPYNTFYYLERSRFVQHLGSLYTKVLLNNGTPTYWVASRCVLVCADNMVNYDIRLVDRGGLDGNFLLRSIGSGRSVERGLFPVVKVNIDKIEETSQEGVFNVK